MTLLAELPAGRAAVVRALTDPAGVLAPAQLQRLGELGFLPSEPVQVLRRGPGGREPLAVLVGDTLVALRLAEARCISVQIAADADALEAG
jgi:ferrous iron transport protein A